MIRLGIVGLDSTHAVAFTELVRAGSGRCRVVAAAPGIVTDFPLSVRRRADIAREVTVRLGVPFVGSIEHLLPQVDAVMILSADGRCHLPEARLVLPARKPVFIDKPLAPGATEGAEIFRLARGCGTPCFSASSLRFSPSIATLRPEARGAGVKVVARGPAGQEPFHPTLSWYGIHTVEALYTVLGPGCQHVVHHATPDLEVATGTWADGRVGRVECSRTGAAEFRVTVSDGARQTTGTGFSYAPLVAALEEFFVTSRPPVPEAETLEILRFVDAAETSRAAGGVPVALAPVAAST